MTDEPDTSDVTADDTDELLDPQIEADVDLLLNTCVEYAQKSFEDRGLFPPIAVGLGLELDDEEEVSLFEPDPEPEGDEQTQEALEGLEEHLRQNRALFRGVALAFDTDGEGDDWDALTILITHASGVSVDVQLPYRDGELGEPLTFPGTLEIFA